MRDPAEGDFGRALALIGVAALLGIPLFAFLWEVLNRLLAGLVDPVRIGVAIPVLAVWLLLLRLIARQTRRLYT